MATPEGKAKTKVLDMLKRRKESGQKLWWQSQAGSQFGTTGVDILLCCYGVFVAIELKRFDGKGKVTTRQALTLDGVRQAGGVSRVVASDTDLMELEFVLDMLRVAKLPPMSNL